MASLAKAHKVMTKEKACERCGYLHNVELHHKKHRAEGGKDNLTNLKWLCQGCHDYQHAKDNVLGAISAENRRLEILEMRLHLIESENTPEKIRSRGYQSYFQLYSEPLFGTTKCGRQ